MARWTSGRRHRRSTLQRPCRERKPRSCRPGATAATPQRRQTCCPRRAPGLLWRSHAVRVRCRWLSVWADSTGAGKPSKGQANSASEAASAMLSWDARAKGARPRSRA
eukprot:9026101-Alexandrium_andersonii.AAC.1